jgi:hypothetical protein
MRFGFFVARIRESIPKDGNPADNNNHRATHKAGEEQNLDNTHCQNQQQVCHFQTDWKPNSIRMI